MAPVLPSTMPSRSRQVATLLVYAAMLVAILALWNNDAPHFIYVAF